MHSRTWVGAALVLLGALMFMNRGSSFGVDSIFTYFWPSLFVIPFGIFFHWLYFSVTGGRGVGLLIPGGILLTAGLVCQIAMLTNGWEYMWPGFIAAVAIGLFEFYWFGNRNRYLMIPITILSVISLVFFAIFSIGTLFSTALGQPMIAIAVVLVGLGLLLGKKKEL
jgi:hypothetical protein